MDKSSTDIKALEQAMRSFFQIMKRPQGWARITAHAGVTIDRPAAYILYYLAENNQLFRLHDLAQKLGVEAPTVTRKTQELEHQGYLTRIPDEQDKRAVSLKITEKGTRLSRRLRKAQRAYIHEALSKFKPEERDEFIALFSRFTEHLSDTFTTDLSTNQR